MLSTTENKMSAAERIQLVDALLASPLAQELQRSIGASSPAVRAWALSKIEPFADKWLPKIELLTQEAQTAAALRDKLKLEYEAAKTLADKAGTEATRVASHYRERRVVLTRLSTASDAWLHEQGICDADSALRYVGGL